MVDLYLQAKMQGELNKRPSLKASKKMPLDLAIEREIDNYLDTIPFDGPLNNQFYSPQMYKAKLKTELIDSLKFEELSICLESAFNILYKEGRLYLEEDQYQSMLKQLYKLSSLTNESVLTESNNLQLLLDIEDATINFLVSIALKKNEEHSYSDSLALFILLTTLIPEDFDFWYRGGMAAQHLGNFKLSINLYQTTLLLNPEHIGALFFITDCYLNSNMPNEAKETFEKANLLLEKAENKEWKHLFEELKDTVEK